MLYCKIAYLKIMSEYVLLRTFKEKIFEVLITLSERTVTSPALHDEELKNQEDGTTISSLTIVIKKDATGDGIIDIFDLTSVFNHIRRKSLLENAYFEAGDTNSDKKINVFDLVTIFNTIRKKG